MLRGPPRRCDTAASPKPKGAWTSSILITVFQEFEFGCELSVLIGVEKYTGMKMAAVVPTKKKDGGTGAFAARKAIELINECGDRELNVIVKSDQEPAINFLMSDISRMRTSGKTLVEESSKRNSGATEWPKGPFKPAKVS